jgi:hypothetical protein
MVDEQDPAPLEDRRGRRVLLLTSLASLLVMGGLVALAVSGQAGAHPDGGGTSLGRPETPPSQLSWEPGCKPDRDRPPHLVVDLPPDGLDFGRVKQGGTIEKTVTFRNDGVGPLCLDQPQISCGCMKATLKDDRKRYEPGESGAFVVSLLTDGQSGPQHKTLSVLTNQYESPRPTWSVKADISLGFVAFPNRLDFGMARRGTEAVARVKLTSPKSDTPWEVVGLSGVKSGAVEPPAYTWEATPLQDPTLQGYDLVVKHPGTQQDQFSASVILRTTHPERPELVLTATLVVTAPLHAWPTSAGFGFVQNGVPAQPTKVVLRPAVPTLVFKVLSVRVEPQDGSAPGPDGPGFLAEARTDEKTHEVAIEVRYDGKSRKAGLVEAVAVVTTDLGDQKEIRIPLRATVTEPKNR